MRLFVSKRGRRPVLATGGFSAASLEARPAFVVAALVTVAAVLRMWDLGVPSLTVDEGMTAYVAFLTARSPADLPAVLRAIGEVHPPGYFAIVQAWSRPGTSEEWLRLSSALAGILAVPLTLWLGAEMRGAEGRGPEEAPGGATEAATTGEVGLRPSPGLLAAGLLLATSSWHVQYSRELRMYPLMGLLVLVAMASFLRYARTGRWGWVALYALAAGAAPWIHYFGGLAPLLAGAWCLRHRRDRMLGWLLGTLGAYLLFLPWVPSLLGQVGAQDLGLRSRPGAAALVELLGRMTSADLFPTGTPLYFVLAVLPLALAAVALRRGRGVDAALWLLIPPALAWAVSAFSGLRLFEFKYFVWCAPFLALLEGEALEPPAPWTRGVLSLLVALHLVSWGLLLYYPMAQNQDWRAVAWEIRSQAPADATVLVQPSMMAAPLLYYGVPPTVLRPVDLPPPEARLKEFSPGSDVWLVTTPHHPLVQRVGLEPLLDRHLWRLRARQRPDDGAWLPSAVTRVIRYRAFGH